MLLSLIICHLLALRANIWPIFCNFTALVRYIKGKSGSVKFFRVVDAMQLFADLAAVFFSDGAGRNVADAALENDNSTHLGSIWGG